jgi:hypothetical protein
VVVVVVVGVVVVFPPHPRRTCGSRHVFDIFLFVENNLKIFLKLLSAKASVVIGKSLRTNSVPTELLTKTRHYNPNLKLQNSSP